MPDANTIRKVCGTCQHYGKHAPTKKDIASNKLKPCHYGCGDRVTYDNRCCVMHIYRRENQ